MANSYAEVVSPDKETVIDYDEASVLEQQRRIGQIEDEEDEMDTKDKGDKMKSRCPFYTIWICWNMDFPKDIMVV